MALETPLQMDQWCSNADRDSAAFFSSKKWHNSSPPLMAYLIWQAMTKQRHLLG